MIFGVIDDVGCDAGVTIPSLMMLMIQDWFSLLYWSKPHLVRNIFLLIIMLGIAIILILSITITIEGGSVALSLQCSQLQRPQ